MKRTGSRSWLAPSAAVLWGVVWFACSQGDSGNDPFGTAGAGGASGAGGSGTDSGAGGSNATTGAAGSSRATGAGGASTTGAGGSPAGAGGAGAGGKGTGAGGNAAGGAAGVGAGGSGVGGAGGAPVNTGANVLQHHKNLSRDGLYVDPAFTKARAAMIHKDANFNATIKGATYAQALYFEGAAGGKNLVISATMQNEVSAFDAVTGALVWTKQAGAPAGGGEFGCGGMATIGITGTPVIDAASKTIFF